MRSSLVFHGFVKSGGGRFSNELVVPGASKSSVIIRDWPERLQPGTLNVRVDRFPDTYVQKFGQPDIRHLDSRMFLPEAELHHSEIANNTIRPQLGQPDRGNAQIWRALLTKLESCFQVQCWVLRRIGSNLSVDLELVSGSHLRNALSLSDNDRIAVEVEGVWGDI